MEAKVKLLVGSPSLSVSLLFVSTSLVSLCSVFPLLFTAHLVYFAVFPPPLLLFLFIHAPVETC